MRSCTRCTCLSNLIAPFSIPYCCRSPRSAAGRHATLAGEPRFSRLTGGFRAENRSLIGQLRSLGMQIYLPQSRRSTGTTCAAQDPRTAMNPPVGYGGSYGHIEWYYPGLANSGAERQTQRSPSRFSGRLTAPRLHQSHKFGWLFERQRKICCIKSWIFPG
jgi:hypothetical protein